ncbi:MAG TPA: alpha/beta fold hydrolase [Thermoanaerobaculia bacterium]|nr:alpha/beta fold hydrolase [Thermoanaerobaculia bacterium]
MRLFCFPYAGGSASIFANWQKALGPEIEVCAVQLPGRAGRMRETPLRRVDALLPLLMDVLAPLFDLPFATFGHSMGSLLAFEVVRAAKRQPGAEPVRLFAAGRRAPHRVDRDEPMTGLPDDEFRRRLGLMNGTPKEILRDEELMNLVLPFLRADFEVNDTYSYVPESIDVPVTALGGIDDPEANLDELAAWGEMTTGRFDVVMFPGDHFFLTSAESMMLDVIGNHLRAALPAFA